ncbi:DUF2272 domain-containing protein [Roseococcus microcysteis]|uniref:DUF2272 domain-containing protein n=1 Tax=Roseococcus microcysteis TaxID=2771361 RepID=UPI00168A83BC|nr:DUF2272 domain-containing protein [Roseococcus microcysteis]
MLSPFEAVLAKTAQQEFSVYGGLDEDFPPLSDRIRQYWEDLGFTFTSVEVPWSAVFVSWCVKQAGATAAEFHFNARHSRFVHWAIANAEARRGVFQGVRFDEAAPQVGDILQWNRGKGTFDFQHAAQNKDYDSHSAIVTTVGEDSAGRFARTIGGNESDTVGVTRISLDENGFIRQRSKFPFICLIQTLK